MSDNKSDHESDSDSDSGTDTEGYSLCHWCKSWVCLEDCGNDYTGYMCCECGEHLPESEHFDDRNPADYTPNDWARIGGLDRDDYIYFNVFKDYNLYKKVITKHYLEEGYKTYNGYKLIKDIKELKKGDIIQAGKNARGYKFGEVVKITNQYIYYEELKRKSLAIHIHNYLGGGTSFLYSVCKGDTAKAEKIENKNIYKIYTDSNKFIYEYNDRAFY